ncbi:hypothetical protein [Macrococcoides canis]|uniref:hypothetical protein n=1 Tax=Macrococcoides canis TaxID=1855823 RepID=UPI0010609741|nr:hypothetical protein [Macrococcus canis]TDM21176.1 hypothetical protein ETI02_11035 [Macrococcus canis]TDM32036.1 hypothetical protein ETI13_10115 [Macrococcus canis]
MLKKYILPIVIAVIIFFILFTIDFWKVPLMDILTSTPFIILLCICALFAALLAYIFSKLAYKVDNDPSLEHYEQDRASFKKFSEMNIFLIISFYFALGSIMLISLNDAPFYLGIISIVTLIIAIVMRYYGYSMINKLYPERDLPENFESDFDDKLIDSLNKEEMITIFTGLYNAFKLTNIVLPAAMLLITIYGYATGIPQHFALSIIAGCAIAINIMYQVTVRKLI